MEYEFEFGLKNPLLGELMLYTPLYRYKKKTKFEILPTQRGKKVGSIFEGMTEVIYTDDPIDEEYTIKKYGKFEKPVFENVIKAWFKCFDIKHNNYIPWINFNLDDLVFGRNYLSKYKNPIIISPFAGGYNPKSQQRCDLRMAPLDRWQKTIDEYKNKYTFIALSDEHKLFKNIEVLDFNLTFREIASIIKAAGLYIGVESGMHHLAIASGAMCVCFIQDKENWDTSWKQGGIYIPNFLYTDDMWIHEPKRSYYLDFNSFDKLKDVL
jgi:ADP-heptose:LPS heptosyltransferase